jgi:iron-sulfur cluster repair protein YtfE (RIC family)
MSNHNPATTYVNYLLAEHRRLHRMLSLVRQSIACDKLESDPQWTMNILKLLRDLRAELRCHFAQEEGEGCLDQAVSFQPVLSPEMNELQREHPRLLARIDGLIATVQDCGGAPFDHVALEEEFDQLCSDLHAHEAAENSILRRGLGADVNNDNQVAAASPNTQRG